MTVAKASIGLNSVGNIAVDRHDAVYIADIDRGEIVKLSSRGDVLSRWGGSGEGSGTFDGVSGLAVDGSGGVYASDEPAGCLHKLSAAGVSVAHWGGNGSAAGQFRRPQGLVLDMQGNILVADTYNSRIQTLSPAGYPLRSWGDSRGSQPGQFDHPADVAVDHQGIVVVADTRNARIQRLSPTGQVLGIVQSGANGDAMECPVGVAIDGEGNLFVADNTAIPRIIRLSPWGAWLDVWRLPAEDAGGYVQGLAVGAGDLYVTAYSSRNTPAVLKLSTRGEVIEIWR